MAEIQGKNVAEVTTGDPIANQIVHTSAFEKLYKKKMKRQPDFIIQEVDDAIEALRTSERPESLGPKKKGILGGTRAFELSHNANRILYSVSREGEVCTVVLHKVCNHKEVYGRD